METGCVASRRHDGSQCSMETAAAQLPPRERAHGDGTEGPHDWFPTPWLTVNPKDAQRAAMEATMGRKYAPTDAPELVAKVVERDEGEIIDAEMLWFAGGAQSRRRAAAGTAGAARRAVMRRDRRMRSMMSTLSAL